MNLPLARSYLEQAIAQRDCALWFERSAERAAFETIRILRRMTAANARAQMRLCARRMVDQLRVQLRSNPRALRDLARRQRAGDVTVAFSPRR